MLTRKRKEHYPHIAEEGERPLTPYELAKRRPIFGTGEPPPEMAELANCQRIHVLADGARPEPTVHRVDGYGDGLWRVDVPVGPEGQIALPGGTALRSEPTELLSEINPDMGSGAWRPEWIDLFYVPRVLPSRKQEPIRRLHGGPDRVKGVFGPDDRSELNETSFPWGNVGKIINSEGQHGSGVLIGDRLVLTAGHAVPWADAAAGNWWMRFVPAYYNGQSLHGAGVESYVTDARGYHPSGPNGDSVGYDWAICRLYEPLGSHLGYFGTKNYVSAWNGQPWWINMGYPINMWFRGASFQSGIAVIEADDDINGGLEIEHQGDTTPGNSGGPMFAFFGDQDPRVIAVQYGYQAEDEGGPVNIGAGGSGMSTLVLWGRSNWP